MFGLGSKNRLRRACGCIRDATEVRQALWFPESHSRLIDALHRTLPLAHNPDERYPKSLSFCT